MYQKALFFIGFCIAFFGSMEFVRSQSPNKIDSLRKIVSKSRSYETAWELAYELFDVDNVEAEHYALIAYDLALSEADSVGIIRSGRLRGQILRRLDNLDGSISILSTVLPISIHYQIDKETRFILNALAIAHSLKAEYDKALEYHFRCLVLREKDGDKKQIAISYNNIGWIYYKLSSFDLALDYYLKSLQIKDELGDLFDKDRLLINIGLCYNGLGQYKKAENSFKSAFQVCEDECDTEILVEGEFGLGNAFFEQGNYSESEMHFVKSFELANNAGIIRFKVENLIFLARLNLTVGKLANVKKYLSEVESISATQYRESLMDFFKLKADYYNSTGDFKNANDFLQKYTTLKDSIYASHVLKNLNQVQTKFAQRENLAIIASKDEVLALNNAVIDQQRVLNWLLGVVVFLTSVLGFVIFNNYRNIKKVNGALATAKQVIEDQNNVLDSQVRTKTQELVHTNEALTKVNDELDNFIYKTSHDIRGPLASLKGMVNLAMMDVRDDKALVYLSKLDITAEKLNTVLTRLLIVNRINHTELKPELILFEPLIQDLLALEIKKGLPEKINVEYDVDQTIHFSSDKEMVRLVLENLLSNAVKFYDTSERAKPFVKIMVGRAKNAVQIRVIDNGTGIAKANRQHLFQMFVRASERSETGGIGLYLAKLASEKLGGDIELASSDEITEFVVTLPDNLPEIIEKRKEEKRKLEEFKV